MFHITPESREHIVQIEQEYMALGIYAYAFVYCHTCQRVFYHYPLSPTRENTPENTRLARRVAEETAFSHMHAFNPTHETRHWKIGVPQPNEIDGGLLPVNADLTASNPQAAKLLAEAEEQAYLLSAPDDIKQ